MGFANRAPLSAALDWIDAQCRTLSAESVAPGDAAGRVVAADVLCGHDFPAIDRAAADGYAIRASDSEGASEYNPLRFPNEACTIVSGHSLPPEADAVLPFGSTSRAGIATVDIVAPVAAGTGIERRGSEARADDLAVAAGQVVRPQDIAWLALAGIERIEVVRRPVVRLVMPGPKNGSRDALTPMLLALVARNGGRAADAAWGSSLLRAAERADLVVIAGRSGAGADDIAGPCIAAAGTLELHGLALRPGGSAGLGRVGGVGVVLLPGDPLGCLVAYDMLAARAIRRLGGRDPLAYAVVQAVLDRKIVSAVGMTDVVRVRIKDGHAMPAGSRGLVSAVRADGFVIVPESSEGWAQGRTVAVHLYGAGG